jgi:hypothetical protein
MFTDFSEKYTASIFPDKTETPLAFFPVFPVQQ